MPVITDHKSELSQIIKRKAVGPKGSRHLNEDDLHIIQPALEFDDLNLTIKAVLVTAVIIQKRNKLEKKLSAQWESGELYLPEVLRKFFFDKSDSDFHSLLHKILQGKDLDPDEASSAFSFLLDENIPDYQKGIFLIGERLKRESFEENYAFLQSMCAHIKPREVNVRLLIDLADPYDGFQRYPIYTPFVAALLASMGLPTYCHGVEKVAPKFGETIHKILDLAGKNPTRPTDDVIQDIEQSDISWGYLDLSVYAPELHGLLSLREKIVKRTFLATIEKLLQPLRSKRANLLVTGFVHTHYKDELAKLLKDKESLERALIVKGIEGSTQSDFRKESEHVVVKNGKWEGRNVKTFQIDYPKNEWKDCNSLAEYTLETGIAALKGEKNVARKIFLNQAMQIAGGLNVLSAEDALLSAKENLDSGKALRHWQRGCN